MLGSGHNKFLASGGLAISSWGADQLMALPPPVAAWIFVAGFKVNKSTSVEAKMFTIYCHETVQIGSTQVI